MSLEILNIQTTTTTVETVTGLVNFNFTNALVNGDRPMSSAAQVQGLDGSVDLTLQLAVPNNPAKLKSEFKKAKEEAFSMPAGLSVIEKMRHSLFDYDYVDRFFYDGVRWNLTKLALSHSIALSNRDIRPNRFRLDRPYPLEKIIPVTIRLLQEQELYEQPQKSIHEGIRERVQELVTLKNVV